MTDHVTYAIPFGVLGDFVNAVWISKRLKKIFDFRGKKITELFGEAK
jgi:ligand-binding SRPBCC domain-containing protein